MYMNTIYRFLPGLKFTIWVGWLTGIIFTSNPRTFPEFKLWKSRFTVYAALLNLAVLCSSLVVTLNFLPSSWVFWKGEDAGGTHFAVTKQQVFSLCYITASAFIRFYLVCKGKAVSRFLRSILTLAESEAASSKIASLSFGWVTSVVTVTIFLVKMSTALYFHVKLELEHLYAMKLELGQGGNLLISAVSFVLLSAPHATPSIVAFSLALITMDHILAEYINFIDSLLRFVQPMTCFDSGTAFVGAHLPKIQKDRIKFLAMDDEKRETLDKLAMRFDQLTGLFRTYDQLMGPLLLNLIAWGCLSVIDIISFILKPVYVHPGISLTPAPWLVLPHSLIMLALLETGQRATNMIKERSDIIRKTMRDVPIMNTQLMKLLKFVAAWEWRMSASGIFTIDRSLLSGIVSTVMTYIIILFQLQDQSGPRV